MTELSIMILVSLVTIVSCFLFIRSIYKDKCKEMEDEYEKKKKSILVQSSFMLSTVLACLKDNKSIYFKGYMNHKECLFKMSYNENAFRHAILSVSVIPFNKIGVNNFKVYVDAESENYLSEFEGFELREITTEEEFENRLNVIKSLL